MTRYVLYVRSSDRTRGAGIVHELHVRAGQELLRGNQQMPAEETILPIMIRAVFEAVEMDRQQQAARRGHQGRERRQNDGDS